MNTIFLIHGSFGSPEENWLPWIKKELEHLGCAVIAPQFPVGAEQSLENWRATFAPYEQLLNEDSIAVGHSLGAAFLLDVIERTHTPIRAAFFVSSFISLLGNPLFDEVNKTFVERTVDWEKIRDNCPHYTIFHGDNDPYVPLAEAEKITHELGINIHIIKNGGHLNAEAGYTTFPELLDEIRKVLILDNLAKIQ